MRKVLAVITVVLILTGPAIPATAAASKPALDAAVNDTAAYILRTVSSLTVDSVGGGWAVLGLARSGFDVPDSYYESYYRAVEQYVREHGAVLHDRKYTENSCVILSLTAAGYDARNVAGCDLTLALGDFERTIWQGLSGPIFALIALDSMDYPVPANPDAVTQATRDMYIDVILRRQLNDGGWNLAAGASPDSMNQPSDPDLTGMALQALAKYQHKPEVKAATDKALIRLSALQNDDGWTSGWGSDSVESTVQVLVALCELGIPFDDPRFVKNGKTAVDNILSLANSDGSFKHTADGSGNRQMATEQAMYGLVAAQRFLDGKNSLYRMTDAVQRGELLPVEEEKPAGAGLPGKNPDVSSVPVSNAGRTFPDIAGHANRAAVEALAERGIINGKTDSSFDPDATMTRAEFAAIITRGLGLAGKAKLTAEEFYFSDVSYENWFYDPVYTAAYYEIVKGTSATTFNPGGTITRQEAAVMVARAAKLCGMDTDFSEAAVRDTLAPFGDYRTVAAWATEAMAFCYSSGILDDTEFDIGPGAAILRCEIAEMLYRMLGSANLL